MTIFDVSMFSKRQISLVFLSSLLIVGVNNTFIKKRNKLREELKKLYGGEGALSDFVFFEKPSPGVFADGDKSLLNRTVLRQRKRKTAKEDTKAMKIFVRALANLKKGKNVETLTKLAELLQLRLYADFEEWNSTWAALEVGKSNETMKDQVIEHYFSSIFEGFNLPESSSDASNTYSDRKKKKYGILKKELENVESVLSEIENIFEPKQKRKRKLWKDYYKLKDDVTYSYLSNVGVCYEKYSQGDDDNSARLCSECLYQIDFGSTV